MICSDRVDDLLMTTNTEPLYFCWLVFYGRLESELKFRKLLPEDLKTIQRDYKLLAPSEFT